MAYRTHPLCCGSPFFPLIPFTVCQFALLKYHCSVPPSKMVANSAVFSKNIIFVGDIQLNCFLQTTLMHGLSACCMYLSVRFLSVTCLSFTNAISFCKALCSFLIFVILLVCILIIKNYIKKDSFFLSIRSKP